MINKGKHQYRFNKNLSEKKVADRWEELNVSRYDNELDGRGVLDYLLANDPNYPDGQVSERDREVAATVIQWLGSPVGMGFIKDIIEIEGIREYLK